MFQIVACLGNEEISSESVPLIVSRVLCDFNQIRYGAHDNNPNSLIPAGDGEVELRNLYQLRVYPITLATNLRLELNSNLIHELNRLDKGTFVVDLTSDCSRNLSELHSLSQQLKYVKIISCTGPYVIHNFVDLPITEIIHNLRSELLFGVSTSPTSSSSSPSIVRVGALSLPIESIETLNRTELKAIDCICRTQLSFSGSPHRSPPLFIEFPHWARNHSQVLDALLSSSSSLSSSFDLSRVVLCHNVLSRETVEYYTTLLSAYPQFILCIDSFGAVETPLHGPMYPNDEEIIVSILRLCHCGHSSRLLLSSHCRYKIHLSCYGGSGYHHVQSFVNQRLSSANVNANANATAAPLQQSPLVGSFSTALLSWYSPPEIKIQEPEMITCTICQKRVPIAEQFEKFHHRYCSSKCLSEHRKRNWT